MSDYEFLKKKYDDLVAKNNAAKAKLDLYFEQLLEHNCKTLEEATAKVDKMGEKCDELGKMIRTLTAQIEGMFDDCK